jgi:signal transduction histidine kinase
VFTAVASAQAKQVRRVLILFESSPSSPLSNLVDEGIRASLDNSSYQIEFHREYMETASFPDAVDQQRFRDFYLNKYRNRMPHVIIAVGPAPLNFAIEAHKKLFPVTPVIFCLPNRVPGDFMLNSDFTGVQGDIAPAGTLMVALRLRPDTKHVAVVSGTSPFDKQQLAAVKEQLKVYERVLDISYLTDLDMPDTLQQLKRLPPRTIVMLAAFGRDLAGNRFTSTQAGQLVVSSANAPVFVLNDRFLNHGEVGGDVSNAVEQGRIAGQMAERVLNGESPAHIQAVKAATTYIFDWRALKRWKLNEKNLPPGSVVLNRQPTVWEQYRWYILGAFVLILAEALLICGLIWQREKRRKAETKLAITHDRLSMAIEAAKFVGWDLDIRTGRNRWFGDLEGMFGISSDTYFAPAGDFQRRIHPDDVDRVDQAIEEAKNKRQPYAAEFRIPQPDGTQHWVIARGKFYYASNGNPERMLGLAMDITNRKLAEEALTTVSRRLMQAQEQERTRIARELHDDVNQRLVLLNVELTNLAKQVPDPGGEVQDTIEELRLGISDLTNDIQEISHRLHSSKLEYLGLLPACRSYCKEIAKRHNVNVQFKADIVPAGIPQDVSLVLFRILQESLQNGIKHGGAHDFQVQLHATGREIELAVHDNGKGFDIDATINGPGLGLISMRERVNLVKGTIFIASKPMAGTQINVRVPLNGSSGANQKTFGAA